MSISDSSFRSSVMDVSSYRECCRLSVKDENFNIFRRFREIVINIDTVNDFLGSVYLNYIREKYPSLISSFGEFSKNDRIGNPFLVDYPGVGPVNPTTVRYAKTFGDLSTLFGRMDGWNVVEIGGGYGGLCRILSGQFQFNSYTIVDLPETLGLIKKYLDSFEIKNVKYVEPAAVQADGIYDLVISNYAFSECQRSVQEAYLTKIVKNSRRGYMICNSVSYNHAYNLTGYSGQELKETLASFGFRVNVSVEDPLTCSPDTDPNCLFVWSSSP